LWTDQFEFFFFRNKKEKLKLIRLPPAHFGDKSGDFNWAAPFEVWHRGLEVGAPLSASPPGDRVIPLNFYQLGAALAIAESAPEETWYFSLVNKEGAQFLWVGTGAQASKGRGSRGPANPAPETMARSVSEWVGVVGRKKERARVVELRTAEPQVARVAEGGSLDFPPIVLDPRANNPTVAYIRGLANAWKALITEEGSTQKEWPDQPTQTTITRRKVCERIDELVFDFSEHLSF